jgi:hypothetical protein
MSFMLLYTTDKTVVYIVMGNFRHHPVVQGVEAATPIITPIAVTAAAGAQAADTYHFTPVAEPVLEHIPGIEHSSSVLGSYAVSMIAVGTADLIANRLALRGHEKAAQRTARAGRIVAWMGSIASLAAAELGLHGTGDKWDVVAGLAATLPGIITGQTWAETLKKYPSTLEHLPTIGQEIDLPSGGMLQTPHPDTLARLTHIDPRVRYFPTDMARADKASSGYEYYRGVTDVMHARIQEDFGGETVAVRGTVASLTEPFPFWARDDSGDKRHMQSVLDILRTGSDDGQDRARVSILTGDDGQLNSQTREWLYQRAWSVNHALRDKPEAARVFPVVVVYRKGAFRDGQPVHGWNDLGSDPEDRIAAIYITDKILDTNRPDTTEEASALRAIIPGTYDFD